MSDNAIVVAFVVLGINAIMIFELFFDGDHCKYIVRLFEKICNGGLSISDMIAIIILFPTLLCCYVIMLILNNIVDNERVQNVWDLTINFFNKPRTKKK